jgi:hypothetical protein
MSRFYGDFDPASTATTSFLSETTTTTGSAEAVIVFNLESDTVNTGGGNSAGESISSSAGVFTFSTAVGTPYGAGTAVFTTGGNTTFGSAIAVDFVEFTSGQAFSFEYWAYFNGTPSAYGQIVDCRNDDANPGGVLQVAHGTGGRLVISDGGGGSESNFIIRGPSTGIVTGAWQHFAVSRDASSTIRMFYDGVQVATTARAFAADNKANGGRPHFLGNVNNNSANLGGKVPGGAYLRDFRVIKDACIYTTAFTTPTSPLTTTSTNIVLTTSSDTRTHSHVWNYPDIYKARRADTWPDLVYDTQIALYLPFNGSLTDFSSYGHTVSAVGDAAVTTSPFQFHGSCAFDGNGDLLTVPHNNIFDFVGNDFTIEGFINITTAAGVQGVYAQWGGTGSRSFKVVISTNAKLEINGSKDGSTGTQVNQIASTALELNTFSHFAVTREGSNFRIFINGVNRGTTTDSGNLYNSSANIAIGGNRADNTSSTLFGNLEDFRVINGLALYTTAFEVPTRSINNTLTVNP